MSSLGQPLEKAASVINKNVIFNPKTYVAASVKVAETGQYGVLSSQRMDSYQ